MRASSSTWAFTIQLPWSRSMPSTDSIGGPSSAASCARACWTISTADIALRRSDARALEADPPPPDPPPPDPPVDLLVERPAPCERLAFEEPPLAAARARLADAGRLADPDPLAVADRLVAGDRLPPVRRASAIAHLQARRREVWRIARSGPLSEAPGEGIREPEVLNLTDRARVAIELELQQLAADARAVVQLAVCLLGDLLGDPGHAADRRQGERDESREQAHPLHLGRQLDEAVGGERAGVLEVQASRVAPAELVDGVVEVRQARLLDQKRDMCRHALMLGAADVRGDG